MKISAKKAIELLIIIVILAVTCGFILKGNATERGDWTVIISFVINIALALAMLLKTAKKYAFSFDLMFWMFGLFFFGLAPLAQHLSGIYSWKITLPSTAELIWCNVLILIWYAVYIAGGILGRKMRFISHSSNNNRIGNVKSDFEYRVRRNAKNILLAMTVCIALYSIIFIEIKNIFVREANTNAALDSDTTLSLLQTHLFRNISLFTLELFIIDKKRKLKLGLILACICFLITCFPTGISRYMAASFYGGLVIICFPKTRRGNWYTIVILFGLIVVFPILNLFRYASQIQQAVAKGSISNVISSSFLEGHFDAHQMFISIIRYVNDDGITFGQQLLGCILFFIPRSLWPGKPYGTGYTVTLAQGLSFNNVSAPLIAELFVNFGLIGIIIGGFWAGMLVTQWDKKYWNEKNRMSKIRYIYPFSMFMFFFMLRGDLMSSLAYTFAQYFIGSVIYYFGVRKKCCEASATRRSNRIR